MRRLGSQQTSWRRERDSNPRYGCPYTHFPGVRLQPLGHLSNRACATKAHAFFGETRAKGALRASSLSERRHVLPTAPVICKRYLSGRAVFRNILMILQI